MSKILVLAEKPSVGKDIARVLGCKKSGNGYIEGNKYVVTWALGHLVTLCDPEKYDDKYKNWSLDYLPMLPKYFKTVVIKSSSRQFNVVKEQITKNDISEIVIATDAGREGELVARWIIEKCHVNKPTKRLWISSVTDKAIKEGFANLKDAKQYDNLYYSAVARSEADWIVGINATRALTCKYNTQLSAGRVQTPTIAMIQSREDEIKNFVPKDYYGVKAVLKGATFTWKDSKNNDTRCFDEKRIDSVISKMGSNSAKIEEVSLKHKKSYSPALYDLTELQRDCNKIYNFSAKETLNIMQKLYEQHKVLTYPRTDSRYITSDVVGTLKDRVKACGKGRFSKVASQIMQKNINSNKSFVDNTKVSDHHAIIPTEESIALATLSDKERKVYELVVSRFLSMLSEPCEYEEMNVTANIGNEIFTAKGKQIKVMGWKEINNFNDEEEHQLLPEFKNGETVAVKNIVKTNGKTTPPAYFNEATLLSAMENPAKYMNNKNASLAKTLGETGGLGTVATRADIIEKLFNTFLIEKKGKDIHITSKGTQLLNLVPKDLKSPELTAKWEQSLSNIAKGKLNKNAFIGEMKEYSKSIVNEIKGSTDKFVHDNLSGERCPECGKKMLEVNGKKGKMLVCQDRQCGYRKSVSFLTNARCPECKKKLELRGQGDGKIYVCPNTNCNFREKASVFNKRFDNKNDKLNKRDVNNYMKKAKKEAEDFSNNPFADLLKDFK